MYDENRRFNFTNFFIKMIIVIVFVLFAVWLISLSNKGLSNSLDVLTDDVFSQNIEKMKEESQAHGHSGIQGRTHIIYDAFVSPHG